MTYFVVIPVDIMNTFGSQKFTISIPLYRAEKRHLPKVVKTLMEQIMDMVDKLEVATCLTPKVFFQINLEKERSIQSQFSLTREVKLGQQGFSIDIADWTGEAPWKLQQMGELKAILRRPVLIDSYKDDFPEFPVKKQCK